MEKLREYMKTNNETVLLEFEEKMKYFRFIKEDAIKQQKQIIADLRETGFCVEKETEMLNLMIDDLNHPDTNSSDNIHHENFKLYYKFMMDEELVYIANILAGRLEARLKEIQKYFGSLDSKIKIPNNYIELYTVAINGIKCVKKVDVVYGGLLVKFKIFGVKYNFQPVGEYIKEIMNTQEYKKYKTGVAA